MLRGLVKKEAGMALPVAIMMIVLVSVMGAGLLVFVRTNLGATVEVNQGQNALNLADAGTQVGKSHLLTVDADFRSYDNITDLAANPPNPESTWSCGSWDNTNKVCSRAGHQLSNLDDAPDLDATVWIQYLKPALTESEARDSNFAPEVVPSGTNYPQGRDYFRVISRGVEGKAVRKVEAIYNSFPQGGRPRAYYAGGTITLNGGVSITNISLFAGGNINGAVRTAITGEDNAYTDWCSPPFNTARRSTTLAGAGALGTVENKAPNRDFDGTTSPRFQAITSVPTTCELASSRTQITFPFQAGSPNMNALRTSAESQAGLSPAGNNYWEVSSSTSVVSIGSTGIQWPANSLSSTVVYVRSTAPSNVINWRIGSNCADPPVRGTLVIDNGQFNVGQNATPLRGTIVVNGAGPGSPNQTNDDVYKSAGNPCMQSFAIVSGDMNLSGNVNAVTQERGNTAATYGLRRVSWRELYQ